MASSQATVSSPSSSPLRKPGDARSPLSDFAQWRIVTASQIAHYVRTYRFLGLIAFVALISALTLVTEIQAGVALVQQVQLHKVSEYLSNFLVWTGLWIILAAGFFGGDALSVDFSTGSGYYMLVLPVRRGTLLAGRYVAATIVTLAVVVVYFAFGVVGGAYFFGASSLPWVTIAEALGLSGLFSLAALSVAFTVSAFFKSPASGVLVTILALYAGFTTLQSTVELAGYEPWWSLTYAGGAMAAVLDTDFVHIQAIPVGEDQFLDLWSAYWQEGAVIMLIYFVAFGILSFYLYQRKEST
jgi:ABC-type transport system involved in multi-copper enzyme maturation permease subunit